MSKIALLGNLRFNFGYPTSHHKWIEIQNDYFNNILYPSLRAELSNNDYIVVTGNTFENVHALPPEIIDHYINFLKTISQISEVYIINGTKDFNKSNNNTHSLEALNNLVGNITTIKSITHVGNMTFLPLQFTLKELQSNPPKSDSNILFSNKQSKMLEHNLFRNYSLKFTSILPIETENAIAIDNIIQMDQNDQGQNAGIKIIDTDTMNVMHIENHRSPKYITLNINSIEDIDALEADNTKNHINLIISNDLLRGNRSAKRRMDILLNERKFNKISHILSEVVEDVNELPKAKIDPSTPFDTLIREEIKNNTTMDAELLLKEYDNVYRILKTKKE